MRCVALRCVSSRNPSPKQKHTLVHPDSNRLVSFAFVSVFVFDSGGDDLQERKKFLVTNTDALIVLPGGPGTWDELWEMACARHLELNALPIVCVNVDGYYEPFREMLDRAHHDKLIRLEPETIVRFADSAEEAVRFVEGPVVYAADKNVCVDAGVDEEAVAARRRKRQRQRQRQQYNGPWENLVLTFVVGTLFGIAVARSAAVRRG
uniref:Cytokinin riboside 5'-monophosphate phosphoribohydrolase n=1 Tax=Pseudo-nitzschia australis TaxID=44445 RepID=A0A7S4ELD4_9STRA